MGYTLSKLHVIIHKNDTNMLSHLKDIENRKLDEPSISPYRILVHRKKLKNRYVDRVTTISSLKPFVV